MTKWTLGNYLKAHRKKTGLSQREVGQLLGYRLPWQVSRHEKSQTMPPLMIALAYQEVFQVPLSALFGGTYAKVAEMVKTNLAALEAELETQCGKGPAAGSAAQKLIWITKRTRKPILDTA